MHEVLSLDPTKWKRKELFYLGNIQLLIKCSFRSNHLGVTKSSEHGVESFIE
jgi:hypothetical protein